MAMRPGSARIVAIGDTGAGSLAAGLTAGELTDALAAGDSVGDSEGDEVVVSAVCPAIGVVAASVCTELVGAAAEALTSDVAAVGADEPVAALSLEARSAVTRGWVGDPGDAPVVLVPVDGFTELTPVGVGAGGAVWPVLAVATGVPAAISTDAAAAAATNNRR